MKTCKEIASEWGVSERTIVNLCNKGKIPGTYKEGRTWLIPDDAVRPSDGRVSSGKYVKNEVSLRKKPLPIGISDYVRAQAEYYYVDKTLMIKEFLDSRPLVSLFTRPRRFGKTLNMDMLRVFFELSEEDTDIYFRDKAIWKCGEVYTKHQGKYPVIFLTFKDVKFDNWTATLSKISSLLQVEFGRHYELASSSKLPDFEKAAYLKIVNGKANEVELSSALESLSRMLFIHHGVSPIIIIDEYDTPIQEGYSSDYYDEIIGFMRNFFSGAFKDNKYLSYGFLTGILRIAQESIFSGMNNLSVNTIFDEEYDSYFGFTFDEVHDMISYYDILDKESEIKEWYDGYMFGAKEIYNPWSVISYISRGCQPQAYWANTGRNEILEDVMKVASDDISDRLFLLLQGSKVIEKIDQTTVYRSLIDNPQNIYSILMAAGYLKAHNEQIQDDGSYMCEIAIPNKEISAVYKNEILSYFIGIGAITKTTANRFAESMYANDNVKLQECIGDYIMKSISFFDAGNEGFYHGLLLGLIALMDNHYKIRSNRESGDGRYDICMFPKKKIHAGIIIEVKWENMSDENKLEDLALEALEQIKEKSYETEMVDEGVEKIIKMGMAFSGKKVVIRTE